MSPAGSVKELAARWAFAADLARAREAALEAEHTVEARLERARLRRAAWAFHATSLKARATPPHRAGQLLAYLDARREEQITGPCYAAMADELRAVVR